MSELTDRVAFLRGLAEGMQLDDSKPESKLLLKMLDLLDEMAKDNDDLHKALDELNEYMESIDEDLADLEADLYDDENEDLAKKETDDEFEGMIEYECPHCGAKIEIDPDEVDFDEDSLCPKCGKDLFPELPDDASDGKEAPEDKK